MPLNKNINVLIVDDEKDICALITDILKDEGIKAKHALNSMDALEKIAEQVPTILLLDVWLEGSHIDGLGLLEIVSKRYPEMPVIMISGHANIETAVNAIKFGAYDFIEKPFKEEKLILSIQRALENKELREENFKLRSKSDDSEQLIGCSNCITSVKSEIEKYAKTNSRIFITGTKGTGKKHIARQFWAESNRNEQKPEVLNFANLTEKDAEEALFGVVSDFGNALKTFSKPGVFEKAQGGTVIFEEICDLPRTLQLKLSKAICTNKYVKPGTSQEIVIDSRIISTSSKDINEMIDNGDFSSDLYHRLNLVPIHLPDLKDRRPDIPLLCEHFLEIIARKTDKPVKKLASDSIAALQAHDWPGNVRQLKNTIEWLTIMSDEKDEEININDLHTASIGGANSVVVSVAGLENVGDIMSMPLREAREVFERQYLLAQVNRFNGNISKTSNFIGMERSALHRKLKSLNVTDIRNISKNKTSEVEEKVVEDA